jgi:hypothetical protein
VNRIVLLIALVAGFAGPLCAAAATIDPSTIADGTYTVKVERVIDATHVLVSLDNGSESTLTAGRSTIDFSKVQPNDQLMLSIISGKVVVYKDLTKH